MATAKLHPTTSSFIVRVPMTDLPDLENNGRFNVLIATDRRQVKKRNLVMTLLSHEPPFMASDVLDLIAGDLFIRRLPPVR